MVVSKPNLNLAAIMKYIITENTAVSKTLPTISFTKIHLKSKTSHIAILIFTSPPFYNYNNVHNNNWHHDESSKNRI